MKRISKILPCSFIAAVTALAGFSALAQHTQIEITNGLVLPPLIRTNGCVYQPVQTGITNGGLAIFPFAITNAGEYWIQGSVLAPSEGENSFFVNIDAEPKDPNMIWDIPVTSSVTNHFVTWRGNGPPNSGQGARKVFVLTAGVHQLVIRGREANTRLSGLVVSPVVPPPLNVRIANAQ